jgi:hypothetical protein
VHYSTLCLFSETTSRSFLARQLGCLTSNPSSHRPLSPFASSLLPAHNFLVTASPSSPYPTAGAHRFPSLVWSRSLTVALTTVVPLPTCLHSHLSKVWQIPSTLFSLPPTSSSLSTSPWIRLSIHQPIPKMPRKASYGYGYGQTSQDLMQSVNHI